MDSLYRQDLEFAGAAIEDGSVFLQSKEEAWGFDFQDLAWECTQRLPTIASEHEFWLLLRELVAGLHDSHAGVLLPGSAQKRRRFGLPFNLANLAGAYYVAGLRDLVSPGEELAVGDEVLAIGGFSMSELQQLYLRYTGICREGILPVRLARSVHLVFNDLLPGVDFAAPLQVDLASPGGQHRTCQVAWAPLPAGLVQGPGDAFSHCWLSQRPGIACLRVRDYFFPQPKERQVAVSRLETIFADLRLAAGVVVDLRGSGGGSFPLMKALVSRLIQEPVPNFKRRWLVSDTFVKYHEWGHRFGSGRRLTEWMCDGWGDQAEIAPAEGPRLSRGVALVVLTDSWTFSRSEALVQLLREAGLASSLGETTGGGYGLPLQLSLPGTGCSLWYSVGEGRSPQGFDIEGQGITPDFPVSLGLVTSDN